MFQLLIPKNPSVLLEIYNITNAVSLSGFIVVPGILFLTDYFKNSIFILEKFRFSITLFFWTVSIQIFLVTSLTYYQQHLYPDIQIVFLKLQEKIQL